MRPEPKGWCPGALRPMEAGDGLIVRVRPRLGRLAAAELSALCAAAEAHGRGLVEITRRGNLQIRGVAPEAHGPLVAALAAASLIDADAEIEARRNLLVDPLWQAGDLTARLAGEFLARLSEAPALPAKFAWAVDCGPVRRLHGTAADVRIERGASGGLIVRADGMEKGMPTGEARAVADALALARWFLDAGGGAAGRMARLVATLPPERRPGGREAPAPEAAIEAGATALGPAVGVPFGEIGAGRLATLVAASGAGAIRPTPGRLIVLEGARLPPGAGDLAIRPGDPRMAVDACIGAPSCAAASVPTRLLAATLAGRVPGGLHVSGCAKGCARSAPAAVTLVGRDGRFDLVLGGRAWDVPAAMGLPAEGPDAEALLERIHAL